MSNLALPTYRCYSDADLVADDAAVLLSIALQHGVDPGELGHSMGRHEGRRPVAITGALCDPLMANQKDRV
jgi:hypothetical protein